MAAMACSCALQWIVEVISKSSGARVVRTVLIGVLLIGVGTAQAQCPNNGCPDGWIAPIPLALCCLSFASGPDMITIDFDKGTVDLGGAKMDDAARSFWVAVQKIAGRSVEVRRTYTADEIDRMRAAVTKARTAGLTLLGGEWMAIPQGSYSIIPAGIGIPREEISREVEDQLRTYMAAGVSPEELERRVTK
jgi:hypothetical protein